MSETLHITSAEELGQNEPTVNGSRINASTNRKGDFLAIVELTALSRVSVSFMVQKGITKAAS